MVEILCGFITVGDPFYITDSDFIISIKNDKWSFRKKKSTRILQNLGIVDLGYIFFKCLDKRNVIIRRKNKLKLCVCEQAIFLILR